MVRQLLIGDGPNHVVTVATGYCVGRHVAAAKEIIAVIAGYDISRRVIPDDESSPAPPKTMSLPAMPPTVSLPSPA